ncbi:MAG TPA: twin-arginine translocase TatA/TatE family subunit [Cytophagaceae bacterium]|jgi:sec-independent protein translocase protein TatA
MNNLLFIGGLGVPEILIIVFALLFLFGAKRIPDLARGIGKGIKEFKDAKKPEADSEKPDEKTKNLEDKN